MNIYDPEIILFDKVSMKEVKCTKSLLLQCGFFRSSIKDFEQELLENGNYLEIKCDQLQITFDNFELFIFALKFRVDSEKFLQMHLVFQILLISDIMMADRIKERCIKYLIEPNRLLLLPDTNMPDTHRIDALEHFLRCKYILDLEPRFRKGMYQQFESYFLGRILPSQLSHVFDEEKSSRIGSLLQLALRDRKFVALKRLFSCIQNIYYMQNQQGGTLQVLPYQYLIPIAIETGDRDAVEVVFSLDIDLSYLMRLNEQLLVDAIELGCFDTISYLKLDLLLLNTTEKERILFILYRLFEKPLLFQQAILKLLFWAQMNNKFDIFKLTLERISFPLSLLHNDYFPEGANFFHVAAQTGRKGILQLLLSKDNEMKNSKNIYGQTPLHIAAQNNHKDVTLILIASECEYDVWDVYGRTPLEIAILELNKQTWEHNQSILLKEIIDILETQMLK